MKKTTFKTRLGQVIEPMQILVADDHYASRLLTQSLLQRENHNIALAGNGKAAVDLCKTQSFNLILLDILMPSMDGFQALKRIKAIKNGNADIPVFALTAHSHAAEIKLILLKGFDAVLQKPFRVTEMMRQLDRPYKANVTPLMQDKQYPSVDAAIYTNVVDMPLLEVQTLDILLGAIGPDRMCNVLKAYWQDAHKMIKTLKATRITTSLGAETELVNLRKTAHNLKGASANIGLLKAARLSALLQNAPIEDIPFLIETLDLTLRDSQPAIRDFCGLAGEATKPILAAAS